MEHKVGVTFKTRYGYIKVTNRTECPCDCCAFYDMASIGRKWEYKKICYEQFPCCAANRKDNTDVTYEFNPDRK